MKELIIKVDNLNIYLSPELIIPIQQSNIPIQHCMFRSHEEIYWKVELVEYDTDNKYCKVNVIDYFSKEIEVYNNQELIIEVDRIAFEKLEWENFEQHLASYQKNKLLHILQNQDVEMFHSKKLKEKDVWDYTPTEAPYISNSLKNNVLHANEMQEHAIQLRRIEFSVNFSNAFFKLGYITFTKYLKEFDKKVDFKITNDYILEEFEHIKAWFVKVLKTKKFKVYATITTTDYVITEITAISPQIEIIDASLIESIKYQRTIALTKVPKLNESDKKFYTAEEIFGQMETVSIEGNVFNQSEEEILSTLLEYKNTRNRKQLEYLSEKKQSVNEKIRFTLNPHFGFLFFIEGKGSNHFVWELLDSHATYVWSLKKTEIGIDELYQRIEASINIIRRVGREQYKRNYKQAQIDNDLVFFVIEHKDITSDLDEGFVKWKLNIEEKLT